MWKQGKPPLHPMAKQQMTDNVIVVEDVTDDQRDDLIDLTLMESQSQEQLQNHVLSSSSDDPQTMESNEENPIRIDDVEQIRAQNKSPVPQYYTTGGALPKPPFNEELIEVESTNSSIAKSFASSQFSSSRFLEIHGSERSPVNVESQTRNPHMYENHEDANNPIHLEHIEEDEEDHGNQMSSPFEILALNGEREPMHTIEETIHFVDDEGSVEKIEEESFHSSTTPTDAASSPTRSPTALGPSTYRWNQEPELQQGSPERNARELANEPNSDFMDQRHSSPKLESHHNEILEETSQDMGEQARVSSFAQEINTSPRFVSSTYRRAMELKEATAARIGAFGGDSGSQTNLQTQEGNVSDPEAAIARLRNRFGHPIRSTDQSSESDFYAHQENGNLSAGSPQGLQEEREGEVGDEEKRTMWKRPSKASLPSSAQNDQDSNPVGNQEQVSSTLWQKPSSIRGRSENLEFHRPRPIYTSSQAPPSPLESTPAKALLEQQQQQPPMTEKRLKVLEKARALLSSPKSKEIAEKNKIRQEVSAQTGSSENKVSSEDESKKHMNEDTSSLSSKEKAEELAEDVITEKDSEAKEADCARENNGADNLSVFSEQMPSGTIKSLCSADGSVEFYEKLSKELLKNETEDVVEVASEDAKSVGDSHFEQRKEDESSKVENPNDDHSASYKPLKSDDSSVRSQHQDQKGSRNDVSSDEKTRETVGFPSFKNRQSSMHEKSNSASGVGIEGSGSRLKDLEKEVLWPKKKSYSRPKKLDNEDNQTAEATAFDRLRATLMELDVSEENNLAFSSSEEQPETKRLSKSFRRKNGVVPIPIEPILSNYSQEMVASPTPSNIEVGVENESATDGALGRETQGESQHVKSFKEGSHVGGASNGSLDGSSPATLLNTTETKREEIVLTRKEDTAPKVEIPKEHGKQTKGKRQASEKQKLVGRSATTPVHHNGAQQPKSKRNQKVPGFYNGDLEESDIDRDADTREDTDSKISLVSYLGSEDSDLDTNFESSTVPMIVKMLDRGCAWLEGHNCGFEAPSLLKESKSRGPSSANSLLPHSAGISSRSLRKKAPLVSKYAGRKKDSKNNHKRGRDDEKIVDISKVEELRDSASHGTEKVNPSRPPAVGDDSPYQRRLVEQLGENIIEEDSDTDDEDYRNLVITFSEVQRQSGIIPDKENKRHMSLDTEDEILLESYANVPTDMEQEENYVEQATESSEYPIQSQETENSQNVEERTPAEQSYDRYPLMYNGSEREPMINLLNLEASPSQSDKEILENERYSSYFNDKIYQGSPKPVIDQGKYEIDPEVSAVSTDNIELARNARSFEDTQETRQFALDPPEEIPESPKNSSFNEPPPTRSSVDPAELRSVQYDVAYGKGYRYNSMAHKQQQQQDRRSNAHSECNENLYNDYGTDHKHKVKAETVLEAMMHANHTASGENNTFSRAGDRFLQRRSHRRKAGGPEETQSTKSSSSSYKVSSLNTEKDPPPIDADVFMNLTEEERLAALELAERLRRRAQKLKRRRKKREKRMRNQHHQQHMAGLVGV